MNYGTNEYDRYFEAEKSKCEDSSGEWASGRCLDYVGFCTLPAAYLMFYGEPLMEQKSAECPNNDYASK